MNLSSTILGCKDEIRKSEVVAKSMGGLLYFPGGGGGIIEIL